MNTIKNQYETNNTSHSVHDKSNKTICTILQSLDANLKTLEFDQILIRLMDYAVSNPAKEKLAALRPYLRETDARQKMLETTEGRRLYDYLGNPPLTAMSSMNEVLLLCQQESILLPEHLTCVMQFLTSCKRLKRYLERGAQLDLPICSYSYSIDTLDDLYEELSHSIYNNQVDDSASSDLRNIRRKIENTEMSIKQKLESLLRGKREYFADHYVSNRNGHSVLPVKREYKHQISGTVIDVSATGSTYFIEPTAISKLQEEIASLRIMEENEIRKILYILTSFVSDSLDALRMNMQIMESLDIIFAKAKLSADLSCNPVTLTTSHIIHIVNGKHPLLNQQDCVPLNFHMDEDTTGIVITGPNTGGKTVALKTVGLLSIMAQCGLHIPAGKESVIAMHNLVLCDIGDGQSITQNLSTFSAHITNVIHIIQQATVESLVLLDELGSGTDPAEGMGIAISILEELRSIPCRFVATTHYPEVKEYVSCAKDLVNARMEFDRVSLRPMYQLIVGEAGESCALYIAKQLGFPDRMLETARSYAYRDDSKHTPITNVKEVVIPKSKKKQSFRNSTSPSLVKVNEKKQNALKNKYHIGDSVLVYPQKIIGIVYEPTPTPTGEICVQIRGKKQLINHKRLKLKTPATELYPADYDFSVIFDSVELRKTRHQTNRMYRGNTSVSLDE
ncbi:endonuclease MutS2 [Anaerosporobacter faecicola]|uniref:endonuclease MutS2 n=1 Tax=Anaerosporobacter faecicola TaxID=2718714 RepID=UPI0014395CD2|nr:DNA mismatch repair protein MutS [Anaerosporobacter faecicola]